MVELSSESSMWEPYSCVLYTLFVWRRSHFFLFNSSRLPVTALKPPWTVETTTLQPWMASRPWTTLTSFHTLLPPVSCVGERASHRCTGFYFILLLAPQSECTQTVYVCVFVSERERETLWCSKAAEWLCYLRPIKPGALFLAAGRGRAACWGWQNGEGIPLNWNHVGAHIFTSAAELKTMFWWVPWYVFLFFFFSVKGHLTENLLGLCPDGVILQAHGT